MAVLAWKPTTALYEPTTFKCKPLIRLRLRHGRGAQRDSVEALKWYRLATDQG